MPVGGAARGCEGREEEAGFKISAGEKSFGSMSGGSESESEISSMRAWRDILGMRLVRNGIEDRYVSST